MVNEIMVRISLPPIMMLPLCYRTRRLLWKLLCKLIELYFIPIYMPFYEHNVYTHIEAQISKKLSISYAYFRASFLYINCENKLINLIIIFSQSFQQSRRYTFSSFSDPLPTHSLRRRSNHEIYSFECSQVSIF